MITSQDKSVDADVLGPAYSFNQPSAPAAIGQELTQTLLQTWDSAANVWVQSLQQAWKAPFGFSSFLWGRLDRDSPSAAPGWKPDFSITRTGNAITVSAMLPGAREDDVEVEIRDGKLVIAGECNFSESDDSSDQFSESIDLLNLVDSQSVEARIGEDGFLEISLKLHDASGPAPRTGESRDH
ncbi:MAG: Hsp20 family protein [Rubrivivax sp.]|nr:MAG: Hsp20 family protein [Rubrivivax sp.]